MDDLVDEKPEQRKDDDDGGDLSAATHQTMKTVVPTRTWSYSHSESTTCILMQPCEAFQPMEPVSYTHLTLPTTPYV